MKILSKAFLIAALVIGPMAACAPAMEAAALSVTHTTPQQASSLKAAGDLYTLGAHAATAYLKSGKATKAQAAAIMKIDTQLHASLKAGLAAERKGDSPAAGAALALFNQNWSTLKSMVPGL